MCDAVHLSDGRTCSTIADLRAAGFVVHGHDLLVDATDDSCLCSLDVEAVLNRAMQSWDLWGWTPEDGYWCGVPS